MSVSSLTCSNCGAPLALSSGMPGIAHCSYCGSALHIDRGVSEVNLEIKRLQLSQEIASLRLELVKIQSELHPLERQRVSKNNKQYKQLKAQEDYLNFKLSGLEKELRTLPAPISTSLLRDSKPITEKSVYQKKTFPVRQWGMTLFLCTLFGWLGLHRFYTGYTRIGLFQLLTVGGFELWWFYDIFLLLIGNYQDALGRELENYQKETGRGCITAVLLYFGSLTSLTILLAGGVQDKQLPPNQIFSNLLALTVLFLPVVIASLGYFLGKYPKKAGKLVRNLINMKGKAI